MSIITTGSATQSAIQHVVNAKRHWAAILRTNQNGDVINGGEEIKCYGEVFDHADGSYSKMPRGIGILATLRKK